MNYPISLSNDEASALVCESDRRISGGNHKTNQKINKCPSCGGPMPYAINYCPTCVMKQAGDISNEEIIRLDRIQTTLVWVSACLLVGSIVFIILAF